MCERCTELEAADAAMRAALGESLELFSLGVDCGTFHESSRKYKEARADGESIERQVTAALATDAGRALAARLARLKRVAQATREYLRLDDDCRFWARSLLKLHDVDSDKRLGECEAALAVSAKTLRDALAALEPGGA